VLYLEQEVLVQQLRLLLLLVLLLPAGVLAAAFASAEQASLQELQRGPPC